MRSRRKLLSGAGLLAVAGVTAAVGAGPFLVSGADHLDGPLVTVDKRVDLTDIYAWRTSPSTTTLALSVNPLTSVPDTNKAAFRPHALYEFKIDTNGDALADIAYRIRFSNVHTFANGSNDQAYTVKRATGSAARRTEWTGTVVATSRTTRNGRANRVAGIIGGGSAFAGPRDDSFFFDLVGFKHLKSQLLTGDTNVSSLLSAFTGTDTFAGTNVSSIVLKLPNSKLGGTGKAVGVWATTAINLPTGYQRVDRMGRPAINTVFNITDGEKDLTNLTNPRDDRATMKDTTVSVLNAFGHVLTANGLPAYSAAEKNAIANVLLPDTLTLTLGNPAGFASGTSLATLKLNGRRPADDVINAEFALVTNFNITDDGVNANDKPFSTSFPFLAAPH